MHNWGLRRKISSAIFCWKLENLFFTVNHVNKSNGSSFWKFFRLFMLSLTTLCYYLEESKRAVWRWLVHIPDLSFQYRWTGDYGFKLYRNKLDVLKDSFRIRGQCRQTLVDKNARMVSVWTRMSAIDNDRGCRRKTRTEANGTRGTISNDCKTLHFALPV